MSKTRAYEPGQPVLFKPGPGLGNWRPGTAADPPVDASGIVHVRDARGVIHGVSPSRVKPAEQRPERGLSLRKLAPESVPPEEVRLISEIAAPSRAVPKPKAPARSRSYLAWIRTLPCCNCHAPPPSDPDHYGPRGVGQKTDDLRCVPVCRPCHRARTDTNALPGLSQAGTHELILSTQVALLVEWIATKEAA